MRRRWMLLGSVAIVSVTMAIATQRSAIRSSSEAKVSTTSVAVSRLVARPSTTPIAHHDAPTQAAPAAAEDGGDDVEAKLEALDALAQAHDVSSLGRLTATELRAEPDTAPKVIQTVAALGADPAATKADRHLAASTLSHWLREESRRGTPDAVGNVPTLLEALGNVGGPDAAATLASALDDEHHDLAEHTLTVQMLAKIGDRRFAPAIARFSERLHASNAPVHDAMDRELHKEAQSEAELALRRLAHSP